jgi:hypothetical protein
MKGSKYLVALALVALLTAAALPAAGTLAQGGAGYNLTWWTVDGGGVSDAGAPSTFRLGGTIGQPDAGAWAGGVYTLVGGFWGGSRGEEGLIFLPLIVRQY